MDMEQVRFNMVEQQIRPWDVLNEQVLELLMKVKRELFVPADRQALAFVDMDIPLGYGALMWPPKLEARALQSLELKSRDKVLEIGTGSGYLTALMAKLAGNVTSVEIVPELSELAARNLSTQKINNVTLVVGDGANGWGKEQYDAIVVTGSLPILPEALLSNLAIGGRLFVVTGEGAAMHAELISCIAPGSYQKTILFETSIAALQNALQPQRFVF
jgi:protein-L-isoaspartate(D-aspartate) O-methyltransferase